jgi:hypothetical protein
MTPERIAELRGVAEEAKAEVAGSVFADGTYDIDGPTWPLDRCGTLADAVIELADRLEEAKEWMQHDCDCPFGRLSSATGHSCTCGLDEFLNSKEERGREAVGGDPLPWEDEP